MKTMLPSGLANGRLTYEIIKTVPQGPRLIRSASTYTLLVPDPFAGARPARLSRGDAVKAEQRLVPFEGGTGYAVSPVSGQLGAVEPVIGDFGQRFIALTITPDDSDERDEGFAAVSAAPSLADARAYLNCLPGNPDFDRLDDPARRIHTLVVCGLDPDLLVATNQVVLQERWDEVMAGIAALTAMVGLERVVVAVPRELIQGFGHVTAEIRAVDHHYPAGIPHLMMRELFDRVVPAGQRPEDLGTTFFSAEALASLGRACRRGRLPVEKTLTLVDKAGRRCLTAAVVGTPVGDVLAAAGVTTADGDRIICGGPLRGAAIYSEAAPVRPDTDAIMVQDAADIVPLSDYPCINCGECVRICPARIPVNMLVRFLEARQYDTAAREYDLQACIECGLCSLVCVARIPVFQYIRLGKYELARIQAAEATQDEA